MRFYAKLLLILFFIFISNSIKAQQQQWASQYASWSFDPNIQIDSLDQQVWINTPNITSFWPLQFSWKNGNGEGGYMGLQQQQDASSQIVRFSLWNATEAIGDNCRPFGGEGIGYTCEKSVTIDTNNFYRVRLTRLNAVADGQWWGAKFMELINGKVIEHTVGQIKVPLNYNEINPGSISNFVEYYGDVVAQCKDVPLSIVGLTPPSVNYQGGRTYGGYSTYNTSIPATGNICMNGTESIGAFITATPFDFGFSNGVMMFMGGTKDQHVFDSQTKPTPDYLPDAEIIFNSNFDTTTNPITPQCEVNGNLLTNCAVTNDVQNWNASVGTISHFPGESHSANGGAASLTSDANQLLSIVTQCVPVTGGASYSQFYWAREVNAGEDWTCTMNIIESTSATCASDPGDNVINGDFIEPSMAWTLIQLPDVTMAPGTTHALYDMSCFNDSASDNSLILDDMVFGQGLTPPTSR